VPPPRRPATATAPRSEASGGTEVVDGPPVDALAGALGEVDVVAAGVAAPTGGRGATPDRAAFLLAARYGVDLHALVDAEKISGRAGESVRVPSQPGTGLPARFHLVGTGTGTPAHLRRAAAAAARLGRGRATLLTSLAAGAGRQEARAVVEGLLLGGYGAPAQGIRSRADSAAVLRAVLLGPLPSGAVDAGSSHARATITARDLTNTPANVKSPAWLADRAATLARVAGLEVEVLDERDLAAHGFGGLLAVGRGSPSPPRLVRLEYRPDGEPPDGRRAAAGRWPVALVGKGITYDTGGLSIKHREAMVTMKTDMAGAAAVQAALAACPALGVRRRVVGLLPLAENAVSGSSYRPGDVVRHYGGRTSEVANTDAEGRMVLADALAFADATLDPDLLVDLATLTGAASLGLGRRQAALFATDEGLAAGLERAAVAAGEALWRMPLVEDYRGALDSDVADLRHVAATGTVGAGSITAALFLREFTGGRRWAHLDIAGPARSDKDEYEISKGATGYGARLLLRWLEGLR
jgi:leucyl aminopeptidase